MAPVHACRIVIFSEREVMTRIQPSVLSSAKARAGTNIDHCRSLNVWPARLSAERRNEAIFY